MPLAVPVDDETLLQLAEEPAEAVFPFMRQSAAMWPLVAGLCVFISLWSAAQAPLTDETAAWGLHSLRLISNMRWAVPAEVGKALRGQPPLGTWLTAWGLALIPTDPAGLVCFSWLSVAGVVALAYVLARRLFDSQTALWGALFLVGQPYLLALAQRPQAGAFMLFLLLVCLAGLAAHLPQTARSVSAGLVAAGLAAGASFAAGGPIALAVVGIGVLFAISWRSGAGPRVPAPGREHPRRLRGLKSLIAAALIGPLLALWWTHLVARGAGAGYWVAWWNYLPLGDWLRLPAPTSPGALPEPLVTSPAVFGLLPWLWGMAALGLWRLSMQIQSAENLSESREQRALLGWTIVAAMLWLSAVLAGHRSPFGETFWPAFAAIPLSLCAAYGLTSIVEREVDFRAVLAVLALQAVALVVWWHDRGNPQRLGSPALVSAIALSALSWWLVIRLATSETRRRRVLQACLIALLTAHGATAWLSLEHRTADDTKWMAVRRDLTRIEGVNHVDLFATDAPAVTLQYLAHRVWPDAVYHEAASLAALAAESAEEAAPGVRAVIVWAPPGERWLTGTALETLLQPVGIPRIYRGRELQTFVIRGAAEEPSEDR